MARGRTAVGVDLNCSRVDVAAAASSINATNASEIRHLEERRAILPGPECYALTQLTGCEGSFLAAPFLRDGFLYAGGGASNARRRRRTPWPSASMASCKN